MARVTLDLPEQFLYTHTINVRMTDLNTGKHVGNDQMISLLSEARYRFFCDIDYSQERIVVTDLVASYRAESFAQDDLQFEVGLMDFNKYGGDFVFRVTKADSGQPVALAKYGFVFFNYQSREVTPMPESFRARFA